MRIFPTAIAVATILGLGSMVGAEERSAVPTKNFFAFSTTKPHLVSLMASFILIMGVAGAQVVAQPLSKADFDELIKLSKRQCFVEQKSRKVNTGISDIVIERYCECSVSALFPSTLTYEKIGQAGKIFQSQGREAMISFLLGDHNIDDVSIDCGQKALQ